ncbi:MAG: Eco57I restriction-modification methylase domain-containing protein [Bradymonadales bacterium]|nr:Eco57I restriction-modification methylase domain-containing protein [Bradymonadales bacterium]
MLAAVGRTLNEKPFRRWMQDLARSEPLRRFLHLAVPSKGRNLLGIVRPGVQGADACCVRELTPLLFEEVTQIPYLSRDHLVHRLADILGREDLTRRFFLRLRSVLHRLEQAWENLATADSDEITRRDLTLTLLCRLMFVTFLSRERTLNGQRDYLRWLLERPRSGDIYRSLLRPLFFSALNTQESLRAPSTHVLGDLPFLNGGLFHPLQVEVRNVALTLPDDLLAEGIHQLFDRFQFTSNESRRGMGRFAIDPEMLGQAFEALMNEEERRKSGSFYTPVALVSSLVREALSELASSLGQREQDWVDAALRMAAPEDLEPRQAERLAGMLCEVKVLDPAVGSGAFLLGMLNALVLLRQDLARTTGECRDPGRLRRQIIARNLYGVDVKAGAVRLCELRLWLSLVACGEPLDPVEPLPNLDHHIRQGDSLSAPVTEEMEKWSVPCTKEQLERDLGFADLHGEDKKREVDRRHQEELCRLKTVLAMMERDRKARLSELTTATQGSDLFGHPINPTPAQREQKRMIEQELVQIDIQRRSVEREELPFFSFAATFPSVSRRGGFDLVIGNPPWVRFHQIDPEKRRFYRRRYGFCRPSGSGFHQQVDLSALFVERGLELARAGGLVAFLLPAKLFSTRYGQALRGQLSEQFSVRRFTDYSLQRTRLFAACNYPSWLLVKKTLPRKRDLTILSVATPSGELVSQRLSSSLLATSSGGDSWSALPRTLLDALDEMKIGGSLLADHGLKPLLGLKTGANRLFLSAQWSACDQQEVELIMADGSRIRLAIDLAPPIVRGRDVRAFRLMPKERILLAYNRTSLRPLSTCPSQVEAYLRSHREQLQSRRDHRGRLPLWSLFRTAAIQTCPKIVWRDIAPCLEAAYCPREEDTIPLNTVYFSPCSDPDQARVLEVLLNCCWIRIYAVASAQPAMSGYFRFFAHTVAHLPWPDRLRPSSPEAKRLVELSVQAHQRWDQDVGANIDDLTAFLYGLSRHARRAFQEIGRFYPQLAAQHPLLQRGETLQNPPPDPQGA